MTPKYLRDLRRKMITAFDSGELRTIVFDLGIDWGELRGETNKEKTVAMISHQMRKGKLEELITVLKEERPDIDWPEEIPSPEQQIKDERANIPESEREMVLREYLRDMKEVASNQGYDPVSIATAQAHTDSAWAFLDARRKSIVLRLLHDIELLRFLTHENRDMSEVDLSNVNLSKADLREADLSQADLTMTNLSEALLTGVNLSEANLVWANLAGANLASANLAGAFLDGANLIGAILSWANLSQAGLSGAMLWDATLIETDLSQADLSGAMLFGAALIQTDLSQVKYNIATTWPEGFEPEEHDLIFEA